MERTITEVTDFVGDDIAPVVQCIIDSGDVAVIPRHPDGAPWVWTSIAPRSGAAIRVESDEVRIDAVDSAVPMIETDGSVHRISVVGGEWRGQLWRHHGRAALTRSVLRDLQVVGYGAERCIDIGAAVALHLDGVQVRDCEVGLSLGGLGACNGVMVSRLRSLRCEIGVLLPASDDELDYPGAQRVGVTIADSIIEQYAHHAVVAEGWSYQLALERIHYEPAPACDGADIVLRSLWRADGQYHPPCHARITGGTLTMGRPGQAHRIELAGRATVALTGVDVLVDSHQVVIASDCARGYDSVADWVRIQRRSGGEVIDYDSALAACSGAGRVIVRSPHPASSGVKIDA